MAQNVSDRAFFLAIVAAIIGVVSSAVIAAVSWSGKNAAIQAEVLKISTEIRTELAETRERIKDLEEKLGRLEVDVLIQTRDRFDCSQMREWRNLLEALNKELDVPSLNCGS